MILAQCAQTLGLGSGLIGLLSGRTLECKSHFGIVNNLCRGSGHFRFAPFGEFQSACLMIDSVKEDATGAPVDLKKSRRPRPSLATPSRLDRLPPHSMEAEQGVLGCVLLSPNDNLGICIEKFKRGLTTAEEVLKETAQDKL